jgi:hypothetical protein
MAETTHSYLDWQISTLMLAYDVLEPLPRFDVERLTEREKKVNVEVHSLAMATIPASYRENPESEFPPEIVVLLTQATLRRAAEIAGILPTTPPEAT